MLTQKGEKVDSVQRGYSRIGRGITLVILLITLLFTQGCVDALWCYDLAEEEAGNEKLIVRTYGTISTQKFIIIDNDGFVRALHYDGTFISEKPDKRKDRILFKIEDIKNVKITPMLFPNNKKGENEEVKK
jgi:hypothetical protein